MLSEIIDDDNDKLRSLYQSCSFRSSLARMPSTPIIGLLSYRFFSQEQTLSRQHQQLYRFVRDALCWASFRFKYRKRSRGLHYIILPAIEYPAFSNSVKLHKSVERRYWCLRKDGNSDERNPIQVTVTPLH